MMQVFRQNFLTFSTNVICCGEKVDVVIAILRKTTLQHTKDMKCAETQCEKMRNLLSLDKNFVKTAYSVI